MADKLLRHIPTGLIYIDQPAFSTRPDFEPYEPDAVEVPVFVPEAVKASRKGKKVPDAGLTAEPPPEWSDDTGNLS